MRIPLRRWPESRSGGKRRGDNRAGTTSGTTGYDSCKGGSEGNPKRYGADKGGDRLQAPSEAQRSGFGWKRKTRGMNELSRLRGSERHGAVSDDIASIGLCRHNPPRESPEYPRSRNGKAPAERRNQITMERTIEWKKKTTRSSSLCA